MDSKEDELFLKEIWPYIANLLHSNEYYFSSLIQVNDDNLVHQLAESIHSNTLVYKDLNAKQRNNLPPLEKNKLITIQVEPCENIEDVCEEFRVLYTNVINQITQEKPVEIMWRQWLECVNKLFKAAGKEPISFPSYTTFTPISPSHITPILSPQHNTPTQQNIRQITTNQIITTNQQNITTENQGTTTAEQNVTRGNTTAREINQSTTSQQNITRENITANLIEPPYENLLNLSSERIYRIYNHMTELPVMDKQEKEELLLLLNAITTPEKPYQHIQTAIIHSLAQTS